MTAGHPHPRTLHRLLNHCLPLYFPEIAPYFHSTRAEWLLQLLSFSSSTQPRHDIGFYLKLPNAQQRLDVYDWMSTRGSRSCARVLRPGLLDLTEQVN